MLTSSVWSSSKWKLSPISDVHHVALAAMRTVAGVEYATIDFGISMRNVAVQCDVFETELLAEMANLKFGLELTQYPPEGRAKKVKQYRRAIRRIGRPDAS